MGQVYFPNPSDSILESTTREGGERGERGRGRAEGERERERERGESGRERGRGREKWELKL